MPSATLQLIVGLQNPGDRYADTRHNAGAWLVDALAYYHGATFKAASKLFGAVARVEADGVSCRLFKPATYMNESGRALAAITRYYNIEPSDILIAHDEIDFEAGVCKFKQGGGHAGHNGLRDIVKALGTKDFWRCRLGVGHPGHKDQVSDYVLSRPSVSDRTAIDAQIDSVTARGLSSVLQHCKAK